MIQVIMRFGRQLDFGYTNFWENLLHENSLKRLCNAKVLF